MLNRSIDDDCRQGDTTKRFLAAVCNISREGLRIRMEQNGGFLWKQKIIGIWQNSSAQNKTLKNIKNNSC